MVVLHAVRSAMLFTERKGRVRMLAGGKVRTEPVFTVPDVEPSSESGLMDITLHPNFKQNNYLYLAYSYNKDGKQVKVVRYLYKDGKLTEDKTIVDHARPRTLLRYAGRRPRCASV